MDCDIKDYHSKERFSNRVEVYLKYRPHYPAEIIPYLKDAIGLSPDHAVADVGSGTGFLSELFLKFGSRVFGIEPNREMRLEGEHYLQSFPNFASINGSAENTGLGEHSIDLVTAAQAFHWFDRGKFRDECRRILRGKSIVCLVWNERDLDSTPLLREYEALLNRYAEHYQEIRHDNITLRDIQDFFGTTELHQKSFPNRQHLDRDGFRGRLLSSSYVPMEGHPSHPAVIESLDAIYDKYNVGGVVEILYETKVYWGALV